MALLAEQDNRVRIPDGTAAVSAEDLSHGENRSLEAIPGRPSRSQKMQPFLQGASQKTYGNGILRLLRVMGGAFVAEKRLRHLYQVPQYSFFRRKNL